MSTYMSAVPVISTGAERSAAKRRDLGGDGQDLSTSLSLGADEPRDSG